jgi:hypothetical protein
MHVQHCKLWIVLIKSIEVSSLVRYEDVMDKMNKNLATDFGLKEKNWEEFREKFKDYHNEGTASPLAALQSSIALFGCQAL